MVLEIDKGSGEDDGDWKSLWRICIEWQEAFWLGIVVAKRLLSYDTLVNHKTLWRGVVLGRILS